MWYPRILVAYDSSEHSHKALEKAVEIAKMNPSSWLDVVYVIHQIPNYAYEFYFPEGITENAYQHGYEILSHAEETLQQIPRQYRSIVLEGHPAQVITQYASDHKCDLIIIGSRGLSGLKELFLGSVSHQVIQQTNTSVIVVK